MWHSLCTYRIALKSFTASLHFMAEMWRYLRFSTMKFPQIIGGIPIECSTYCLTIKRSYEISKCVEGLCQLQSTIKVLWRERIGLLYEGEETLIAWEDLCNEVKALGNHLTADVYCYLLTLLLTYVYCYLLTLMLLQDNNYRSRE